MMRGRLAALLPLLLACCDGEGDHEPILAALPAPRAPEHNPTSAQKAELGRHLFYDRRLSLRENVSCASCHLQQYAFSDGKPLSEGTTGQTAHRNAMSLVNSAYAASLTSANFALEELERQALVPLFGEDPIEMGMAGNEALLIDRLRAERLYASLFAGAFPGEPEPIILANVLRALASFERTLVSARSRYDAWLAGDSDALSESEQRGLALFESPELACAACHGGLFFSSAMAPPGEALIARFENNGLRVRYEAPNRGLYELTGDARDRGKFRPPSLRNLGYTAPYMHDGSRSSLSDVLAHYERGGAGGAEQSPLIRAFSLSAEQRADLLAFLAALDDEAIVSDPQFADPWSGGSVHSPQ